MKKRKEGFIETKGGKVWYEIVGNNATTPLIVSHGGPGFPHDYLEPLGELSDERNVIFYDQLGCGNSQRITDKKFWTLKYFVNELQILVKELNLKNYSILGQSWGAALGVAFALAKPKGLKSLILADPYISTPYWEKDAKRLIKKLPKSTQIALAQEQPTSIAFKKASSEYFGRFVWGTKERPSSAIRSRHKSNLEIYKYMWGVSEFKPNSNLKNLDLSKRLPELDLPVLFMCGKDDEATPESTEYFKNLTPSAKIKVFQKSAHMPQITEPKEYLKTVQEFLKEIE